MTTPLRLKSLHHIRMQVPDVHGNERFARDFGLHEAARHAERVYMRACGSEAYSYVIEPGPKTRIGAIAFLAESRSELERAVHEHGATKIRSLEGPGGGEVVSLVDPDGNPVEIVHGIAERAPDALHREVVINYPGNRRRLNVPHRYPDGPGNPLRLGHLGLFVGDFKRMEAWYTSVLNIRASDRMHLGGPSKFVGGFYRLDRGAEFVDHHIIGFFAMGAPGLHHMSFEVQDTEQQMVSHRFMHKQGHKLVWGVGRHPLGSHVFDMWKDPNGLRFETYSDTDWCNNERPAADHPVEGSEMDMWSNDTPERYFA